MTCPVDRRDAERVQLQRAGQQAADPAGQQRGLPRRHQDAGRPVDDGVAHNTPAAAATGVPHAIDWSAMMLNGSSHAPPYCIAVGLGAIVYLRVTG